MLTFKDSDGKDITLEEINALISSDHEYEVFVGSDSQCHKKAKGVIYVTCIVLYKKGKGGRIFLAKDKEKYANSLKDRLQKEVWRSLEVAFELKKILPSNVDITVHVDVNKDKKYKSADFGQEFISTVVSQGFKCQIKPDAWAAQTVANKSTK
jgi:uncharacterized protein